uniref:PH01B001I13.1 protein n=1 Tax=Phyllostachys edulis TaxID=38705 RepID=L0P1Z2_PHYED|nr:PH01B001I13.1 [Phyllostachys edulis]
MKAGSRSSPPGRRSYWAASVTPVTGCRATQGTPRSFAVRGAAVFARTSRTHVAQGAVVAFARATAGRAGPTALGHRAGVERHDEGQGGGLHAAPGELFRHLGRRVKTDADGEWS